MSPRVREGRDDGPAVYGLIIRLARDDPRGDSAMELVELATSVELVGLLDLLSEYEVVRTRRAIARTAPARVRELELARNLADDDFIDLPSLTLYWHLDVRHLDDETVEVFLERLVGLEGEVSHAYREQEWSAPSGTCSEAKDPLARYQHYLEEVAAPWAWTQPGGQGQKVGVVDIETGWWLDGAGMADHQDLAAHAAHLVSGGVGDDAARNHGTAVLGIIAGLNNGIGISGIAPCLGRLMMVSPLDSGANGTDGHVADALIAAVDASRAGDILVIERQVRLKDSTEKFPGYPAEVDEVTFLGIRAATVNGRIVVEAAGNLNEDLDKVSVPFPLPGNPTFTRSLDRSRSNFIDSHAIMVSAGIISSAGITREPNANHGSRIDCFARSNDIVTLGYNNHAKTLPDDNRKWYSRKRLANTSAATAIIAGVAAITQGMRRAGGHPPFSWRRMRFLLSDPQNGRTPDPTSSSFGAVMPSAHLIKNRNLKWF